MEGAWLIVLILLGGALYASVVLFGPQTFCIMLWGDILLFTDVMRDKYHEGGAPRGFVFSWGHQKECKLAAKNYEMNLRDIPFIMIFIRALPYT